MRNKRDTLLLSAMAMIFGGTGAPLAPQGDGCRTKPIYPFTDDELAALARLEGKQFKKEKKAYIKELKEKYRGAA